MHRRVRRERGEWKRLADRSISQGCTQSGQHVFTVTHAKTLRLNEEKCGEKKMLCVLCGLRGE